MRRSPRQCPLTGKLCGDADRLFMADHGTSRPTLFQLGAAMALFLIWAAFRGAALASRSTFSRQASTRFCSVLVMGSLLG